MLTLQKLTGSLINSLDKSFGTPSCNIDENADFEERDNGEIYFGS